MEKHEFNLDEYIENSNNIENYQRPKLRFFVKYLRQLFSDTVLSDAKFISHLDRDCLLGSLEYFIDEALPAKQTAQDYIRAVVRLMESVCQDFDLENELLTSVAQKERLLEDARNAAQHLSARQNQECMDDEAFEKISEAIRNFFSTPNLENRIASTIRGRDNYYGSLVSAIVLRLIWKYGLGHKAIPRESLI